MKPFLAIALAASALLSGCGGGDDTASNRPASEKTPGGAAVTIKTFMFEPDPITVKAGTTVTFKNLDGTIHTEVGGTREKPDRSLIDGSTDKGETYEVTFDKPGTYNYFCDRHQGPGMTAKVVVE